MADGEVTDLQNARKRGNVLKKPSNKKEKRDRRKVKAFSRGRSLMGKLLLFDKSRKEVAPEIYRAFI